jgi:hypothetical protein
MKYKSLGLLLFIPLTVFAVTGVGDKVNNRAITPSGKIDPRAIKMKGDAKLLGLDSNAKPYLQSKSLKPPSHVKGLNAEFANRLAKFFKAAEGAGGLQIYSGYRSPEHQAKLYAAAKRKYGASARRWVAPPGGSNHNKGTAVDLRFARQRVGNTAQCMRNRACKWAHQNASAFGLKFRMAHEPWHVEPSGSVKGGAGNTQMNMPMGGNQKAAAPMTDPNSGGGQGGSGQQGQGNQAQKPQGGQPPQMPKMGGAGGAQSGGAQNPYSTAGGGDQYGIWGGQDAGKPVESVASISCDPSTISGSERSFIKWNCGGESTRSRGGTNRRYSRFNTKGRLSGQGYARPKADTSYKIQCFSGDKMLSEAVCSISTGSGSASGTVSNSATPVGRPLMHLSAKSKKVGWAGSTTLQWATLNANNCMLNGGKVHERGAKGSVDSGRIYYKTTYTLQCDTSLGSKLVKLEVGIW